jgi:hypothetical protein
MILHQNDHYSSNDDPVTVIITRKSKIREFEARIAVIHSRSDGV